jgi:hypothetical protein
MAKTPESQDPSPPAEEYADMPKVTYRIPTDFRRRLKMAAAAHGRTETSIYLEAVGRWMDENPNPTS